MPLSAKDSPFRKDFYTFFVHISPVHSFTIYSWPFSFSNKNIAFLSPGYPQASYNKIHKNTEGKNPLYISSLKLVSGKISACFDKLRQEKN